MPSKVIKMNNCVKRTTRESNVQLRPFGQASRCQWDTSYARQSETKGGDIRVNWMIKWVKAKMRESNVFLRPFG